MYYNTQTGAVFEHEKQETNAAKSQTLPYITAGT